MSVKTVMCILSVERGFEYSNKTRVATRITITTVESLLSTGRIATYNCHIASYNCRITIYNCRIASYHLSHRNLKLLNR